MLKKKNKNNLEVKGKKQTDEKMFGGGVQYIIKNGIRKTNT